MRMAPNMTSGPSGSKTHLGEGRAIRPSKPDEASGFRGISDRDRVAFTSDRFFDRDILVDRHHFDRDILIDRCLLDLDGSIDIISRTTAEPSARNGSQASSSDHVAPIAPDDTHRFAVVRLQRRSEVPFADPARSR